MNLLELKLWSLVLAFIDLSFVLFLVNIELVLTVDIFAEAPWQVISPYDLHIEVNSLPN